uniref:Uncharacterized protein n=1 Tax=Romanomermis culicivorax TaxID=13658 RepID=A0A915IG62_ROMCU
MPKMNTTGSRLIVEDCDSTATKKNLIANRKSLFILARDLEIDDHDTQTLINRIKSLNDESQRNEEYLENLKWTLDQTRLIKTMAIKKVTLLAYEKREILCSSSSSKSSYFSPLDSDNKKNNQVTAEKTTTPMIKSQLELQKKIATKEKREENLKFHALLCQYYKKLRDLDAELDRLEDEILKLTMIKGEVDNEGEEEKNKDIISKDQRTGQNQNEKKSKTKKDDSGVENEFDSV